jgi:putative aldouronate transport system permease protein
LHIVASSLSSPGAVASAQVFLWPVDFSLVGYQAAFENPLILRGYVNSLGYAAAGSLISVVLTIAIAYPLSRVDLVGRNLVMAFIVFTMLFAGGIIPTYLVVRSLGMIDTPWALLLPQAIGVWQVIIARTYFRSAIPNELYEAAQLDGASDFRFMWSVALPLAKPMIAVIALMYAIGQWNSYFEALMYLKSADLFPLQIILRDVLILNTTGGSTDLAELLERQQLANVLKYALIVAASIPMLVLYPFVARHFTKGVMIGAVKG